MIKEFLNGLIQDVTNTFVINEIVLLEVFHYLIKRFGPTKGKELALKLMNNSFIEIEYSIINENSVLETLDILVKYGVTTTIGGRDSTIIRTMRTTGVMNIISHDRAFELVENLQLIDPLED